MLPSAGHARSGQTTAPVTVPSAGPSKLVLYYMGEEFVTTRLTDADQCTELGTDTAHKGHQMRKALDKQSNALRTLLRKTSNGDSVYRLLLPRIRVRHRPATGRS